MKLWFIIYVGSQIGGAVGPLPYDMAECERRAADQNTKWQDQIATGHDRHGNPVTDLAKEVRFGCQWSADRPAITFNGSAA